jgi:hypothetical protein
MNGSKYYPIRSFATDFLLQTNVDQVVTLPTVFGTRPGWMSVWQPIDILMAFLSPSGPISG